MTCQETTLSLGVYLLGALDAAERADVETHLQSCAVCRAELAALEGLPAMLERLTIDDIGPQQLTVPDELYERVAARARAEHERQQPRMARYRRLTAVAAAVVLIAAGGVGSWAALRSPTAHPGSPVAAGKRHPQVFSDASGAVRMQVTLASQTTGTALVVTVSGLPKNEHCRLIAVAKDGSRDLAGRWDATYGGKAQETGSTGIPRSELSKLVLLGTRGNSLVTVAV